MAEEFPTYIKNRITLFLSKIVPKIPKLSLKIVGDIKYNIMHFTYYPTDYIAIFNVEFGENTCARTEVRYSEGTEYKAVLYIYRLYLFDLSGKCYGNYTYCTPDTEFIEGKYCELGYQYLGIDGGGIFKK